MRVEIKNQSIGLAEVCKKEPVPITATGGKGAQPPIIRTAIGMAEPEENRTPIPFVVWDAFDGSQNLRWRNDDPYDLVMDRKIFWALHNLEPQNLPGLDEILEKYNSLITGLTEPVSTERKNRFLLQAYDQGLIKPQNWRERITLPLKFALLRR